MCQGWPFSRDPFLASGTRIQSSHSPRSPLSLPQWLRPKVIYNYGPKIVGKDGPRPFLFREHSLLQNPNFPKDILDNEVREREEERKSV